MGLLLLILILVFIVGDLVGGYYRYNPRGIPGGLGVILVVIVLMVLLGRGRYY